ncbi:hypothetical protein [Acutalibacter caecimuris]|uniref:hypothetical protein n=1 Tax=Acutalibacter caecimuris TaxID=3093657 RepID=UPI002AC91A02|nr:hypothetical protein [Acutalibacter sp. M00118]
MFIFAEINYRLTRAPGRSVVLILAAVMLVASMGAYLGSLEVSQATLDNLAESIPVTARVVNRSGTRTSRLSVETKHFNALTSLDVHGLLCTAEAAGAFSDSAQSQDPFAGGDTYIVAANCPETLPAVDGNALTLSAGYTGGFLSGDEPVCGVSETYLRQTGLCLGDILSLPMYTLTCSSMGGHYDSMGQQSLKIVASYPYNEVNGQRSPDVAVPVAWLRGAAESAGAHFSYSSLSVVLRNPLRLTEFKEALPALGFKRVNIAETIDGCDAISMEDELFIKTAEELRKNLKTYRSFRLPFFALITVMVMLAVFLVLRGSRRDMAVASSLGEPRLRISLVHFCAAVLTQVLGGCIAMAPLVYKIRLSLWDSLGILLIYLLCASIGTILALIQLLRFDTLTLLTKND